MGFFNSLIDAIFNPPPPPWKPPEPKMVQIEERELEYLHQRAEMNPSRGRVILYHSDDPQDPEAAVFQDLLEGKRTLSQNDATTFLNSWIKFRELCSEICDAYLESHILDIRDRNGWWEPIFHFDLEYDDIVVIWQKKYHDDQTEGRIEPGGEFSFPRQLIWSDWRKICTDKLAERQKIHDEEVKLEQAKAKESNQRWQNERYQHAKALVEEYERKQSPNK